MEGLRGLALAFHKSQLEAWENSLPEKLISEFVEIWSPPQQKIHESIAMVRWFVEKPGPWNHHAMFLCAPCPCWGLCGVSPEFVGPLHLLPSRPKRRGQLVFGWETGSSVAISVHSTLARNSYWGMSLAWTIASNLYIDFHLPNLAGAGSLRI